MDGAFPSTVQAALAFAAFILPGFLLRSGYVRTRARNTVDVGLYAIAEAVVGSLLLLAAAWWWKGQDIFNWAHDGTLIDHQDEAYEFFLALLLAPYPAGLLLGWVVTWFSGRVESYRPAEADTSRRSELFYLLDTGGILTRPTVWDQAWNQVVRGGAALLVRVRTTSGKETVGSIEAGSWVGLTGEPRDVYLRRVYRETESGRWEQVPETEGVVFSAASVESVEFIWSSGGLRESAGEADDDDAGSGAGSDRADDVERL